MIDGVGARNGHMERSRSCYAVHDRQLYRMFSIGDIHFAHALTGRGNARGILTQQIVLNAYHEELLRCAYTNAYAFYSLPLIDRLGGPFASSPSLAGFPFLSQPAGAERGAC